jgi:hypothetical protein
MSERRKKLFSEEQEMEPIDLPPGSLEFDPNEMMDQVELLRSKGQPYGGELERLRQEIEARKEQSPYSERDLDPEAVDRMRQQAEDYFKQVGEPYPDEWKRSSRLKAMIS